MVDFTLVISVDSQYIEQLQVSYQTWIKNKVELRSCPVMVIYDADQLSSADARLKFLHDRKGAFFVPWSDKDNRYGSQRNKMLTALTVLPGLHVKTPWYLKLDTDAVAYSDKTWIDEEWFKPTTWGTPFGRELTRNVLPAYVANSWNYTKPANAIELCDNWADQNPVLKYYPRLNLPFDPKENKIVHPRMCSWIMFGNTEFSKLAGSFALTENGYRLPFASQDTYLGYIAQRLGYPTRITKFKRFGWDNHSNINVLRDAVKKVMEL